IDKSSSVLKGEENIDVVEINTYDIWNQWMEAIKFMQENAKNYDILIIDNITELFRSVLTQLGREGKNNRVPGMDAYQRADFVLMDSFRALKALNKTLVFTAWETTDQYHNPDGQIFNRAFPDIRKSILNNFLGLCDVVARLIVTKDEEENEKRDFILQPTRQSYRDGYKAPWVVAPAGAGKSVIISEIARLTTLKNNHILFLVHRRELIDQIRGTFIANEVNLDYVEFGMVQTIVRRLDKTKKPSLIIVDENHHSLAKSYRKIFDYFSDVPLLGFTATPIRLNGSGLGDVNDVLIEEVDA